MRDSFVKMARGGIYDQVGGGFHRYSVDDRWLVPHFEKMLYDNALLSRLGVHLWQVTRDEEIARVTRETFDWALRGDGVAERRLLLVARRGQRGARGEVLRVERQRSSTRCSARARR